jgi:pimeloyl-ACP methyl ester carboxylesterase
MARTIPGARLVTLRPARHAGLFEHHGPFHAAVGDFLPASAARPGHPVPS